MLTFQKAEAFYSVIQSSKLTDLKNGLIQKAIRYAHIRAEWQFLSDKEKSAQDLDRTAAHNVFIDACNIMSRNMMKIGEDITWRTALTNDRKIIGDFACYIHTFVSINNK
ncbi:MAG: hypothetical protein PHT69_01295 [Bacteroidales bacterium]|nr:hypothetical protein [Bacteroidales bacterium]